MSDVQPYAADAQHDQLTSDVSSPSLCVSCKAKPALEGYPTALCADCREHFIRFPIPLYIRLFGAAVLLIVLIACFFLPRQLRMGAHLARGKRAEAEHRYLTAYKEYKLAEKDLPHNLELQAHLFIASVYAGYYDESGKYGKLISNRQVEDNELADKTNTAIQVFGYSVVTDQYKNLKDQYQGQIPDTALARAHAQYPEDYAVAYQYAGNLYAENKYAQSAQVLNEVIQKAPLDQDAIVLASAVAVERKMPDSAVYYCDELLNINRENIYALSSKARNLLRLGHINEAADPADSCVKFDDSSAYSMGTMALLYHFQNNDAKAKPLIQKLEQDHNPEDTSRVNYVVGVINGTQSL
jgi:tetratricopeptide (TPR) repeat protein